MATDYKFHLLDPKHSIPHDKWYMSEGKAGECSSTPPVLQFTYVFLPHSISISVDTLWCVLV